MQKSTVMKLPDLTVPWRTRKFIVAFESILIALFLFNVLWQSKVQKNCRDGINSMLKELPYPLDCP
jgi:hypothetical protein